MELHNLTGRGTEGYTTFGGVWNRGELTELNVTLSDEKGNKVPVQSKIMARWPDGSIKWSAHTADSRKMGSSVTLLPSLHKPEGSEDGIVIRKEEDGYHVDTGGLTLHIPLGGKDGSGRTALVRDICLRGERAAERIYPLFCLERHETAADGASISRVWESEGEIEEIVLEEEGPLQAVFRFGGAHLKGMECKMPFVIRLYLWKDSPELQLEHTFLYDGTEQRDFLKGLGIGFDMKPGGEPYNRHIRFGTDETPFHETAMTMRCNHPRTSDELLERQLAGEILKFEPGSAEAQASEDLPVWNGYLLHQDSAYHYGIYKRTREECCELTCAQGRRAPGVMHVAGSRAGLLLGIGDFWQKYPSGLSAEGLGEEESRCVAWFYSPKAECYDFRHYDTKSYPMSCYEGFKEVRACATGIGVTCRCRACFTEGRILTEREAEKWAYLLQKPPVYTGTPEYYHEKHAFGLWSLPCRDTESGRLLEGQLEKAFAFYREEVEARNWYGLFDYGDIMHTYDGVRHVWKYDTGGFAWQNTELVPTYWLWLYFLRTGREDVFTMAEAMSRHCSEVDIYHFGPYAGMGSRHNVRHWGCSCKEVRISMAGHHRFLYYLTGALRLKDIFREVKDADRTMARMSMEKGKKRPEIRSGPDWSSLVSDWMTWYEITLDEEYRRKIERGIRDIAKTPFGLASGPDFDYDEKDSRLIYVGESETTPNQHLQICMGGPQIWWETAEMLGDDTLNRLMEELGQIYFLSGEERAALTGGKIRNRSFGWPMLATGIAAYSAMRRQDADLAKQAWQILMKDFGNRIGRGAFDPQPYYENGQGDIFREIVPVSTNATSQWCINVMMCLEFIREYLPESAEEFMEMIQD